MAFISIGKIDRNIIPIVIGCVFCFLSRLLFRVDTQLFKQKIFPNLLASFCRIFTLIHILISKIDSKKVHNSFNKNIQDENKNNNLELIYSEKEDDIVIEGKWGFIVLSAVLIFAQGILLLYTYQIKSNTWIWDILITTFLYYLVFKEKLYKHHYLSMILILLTGLIIDLSLGNLQNDISNNLIFLLLRILRETLYSSIDVNNKYLMEKKFCSVYDLSLYTGIIFNVILYGIFGIFNYYFLKLDDFEKYFSNFDSTELLVSIGVLITQFGIIISGLITNKNNSPCHIFIIYVFGQLAYYLDFSTVSIVLIICFIFILFVTLVFNEIIEINLWGFSYNTKRNIVKRAEEEQARLNRLNSMSTYDENGDIRVSLIELERSESFRDS